MVERLVVVGAGAIGRAIAGLLADAGVPVVLVDRRCGPVPRPIDLRFPDRSRQVAVPRVGSVVAAAPTAADLVAIAVMEHHTADVLDVLDPGVPVVSLQNGVTRLDRIADRGHPTLAGVVFLPAERRGIDAVALPGDPVPGGV
ncbi:MAG: 2-dehydropantoate 2-reductase, partial [Myxococcota bacterium]